MTSSLPTACERAIFLKITERRCTFCMAGMLACPSPSQKQPPHLCLTSLRPMPPSELCHMGSLRHTAPQSLTTSHTTAWLHGCCLLQRHPTPPRRGEEGEEKE